MTNRRVNIAYNYILFPRIEERASKTPPGNRKKIPGKNLQESPNPGETGFGAKRGNALINNQHFNAPRGERDLKFKREIQV